MARDVMSTVSLNWTALRYALPRVSVTVNVWPDRPARIATPIQLPAILLDRNACDAEVVVPASLPACWIRAIDDGWVESVVAVAPFQGVVRVFGGSTAPALNVLILH